MPKVSVHCIYLQGCHAEWVWHEEFPLKVFFFFFFHLVHWTSELWILWNYKSPSEKYVILKYLKENNTQVFRFSSLKVWHFGGRHIKKMLPAVKLKRPDQQNRVCDAETCLSGNPACWHGRGKDQTWSPGNFNMSWINKSKEAMWIQRARLI